MSWDNPVYPIDVNNSILFLCLFLGLAWTSTHSRFGHYFCSNLYGSAPRGPRGVKKSDFFFSQMKLFSFCAKIAPKRHKLQKSSKLKKKCQKTLVFFDFFESSSFWGQYQRAKPQIACLVDPGAPFDTPGTPGAGSIQNISRFQYLFLIFLSGGAPYNFFQLIQNKV